MVTYVFSCTSYFRHGDEHKLAGFSATLQAIISFVENGYIPQSYLVDYLHMIFFSSSYFSSLRV